MEAHSNILNAKETEGTFDSKLHTRYILKLCANTVTNGSGTRIIQIAVYIFSMANFHLEKDS